MQTYLIKTEPHSTGLGQAQRKLDAPVGHEVHVRVHAVALNFRDLMLAEGQYRGANDSPVIPCSDGAGEVIAIGPQVTRFKVGDRVVSAFFADWISGAPRRKTRQTHWVARSTVCWRKKSFCTKKRWSQYRHTSPGLRPLPCLALPSPPGMHCSSRAASRPGTACCCWARAGCRSGACNWQKLLGCTRS